MEIQLELAPTPQPAAYLCDEGCRIGSKTRTPTEMDQLMDAIDNNEPIETYLGPDDHVMLYGQRTAPAYGFDADILAYAIASNASKWFAALFTSQDGSSSAIEAVQNPFQAAALMSIPTSRSKKPIASAWIVRAIIGPFNTHDEIAPVLTIWKSHRPQARLEKTQEVARQFRRRHFFGTVNN